jgi:hypothetical protein
MASNLWTEGKSGFTGIIKHLFFGEGLRERKILFGKARGIKMLMNPAYRLQMMMGTYEYEIQQLFVMYSKKCHYCFDIGAGEAYYSLLYKKYNPGGTVYLVDMDETLRDIQEKNFSINGLYEGIHQYFKPVSDIHDEFYIAADSFEIINNSVLIKIDVEGAESIALRGMKKLLSQNECFLLIETHSLPLEKDCIDFLIQRGYHTKIIKNAWWRFILPERRPLPHNRWLAAWK